MKYLLIFLILVSQSVTANECVNITLYVTNDSDYKNTELHPCGTITSQCLTKIPEGLLNEQFSAYEISFDGNVISKWSLVVDAQVRAISGDNVVIAYPNYQKHSNGWVKPHFALIGIDGRVSKQKAPPDGAQDYFKCSEVTKDKRLKNAFCYKFKDLKSNKVRIINSPPVCT